MKRLDISTGSTTLVFAVSPYKIDHLKNLNFMLCRLQTKFWELDDIKKFNCNV